MLRLIISILCCVALPASMAAAQSLLDVSVTVDFGQDRGQNLGTLFDAVDAEGRHVAGAGFTGVVNSGRRLERMNVQFFAKPSAHAGAYVVESLPRVTEQIGLSVYSLGDEVLVHDGFGAEQFRLNRNADVWEKASNRKYVQLVRGKVLEISGGAICYDEQEVLPVPDKGRYGSVYYGEGHIFFYHYDRNSEDAFNYICAVPWDAYSGQNPDPSQIKYIEATVLAEFAYSYGQLNGAVVNCSNWGGFYVFKDGEWSVLRKPDPSTSYQIYCMINFEDRLLMGQYPAGSMFAYDGEQIDELRDWPPVPSGVSNKLREVQSVAVYRGELFVGVWPWGELWRYDRDSGQWTMLQRMFDHPKTQADTVHPYEEACRAAGLVHNELGQRVPALLSVDDALLVTTASKSSWSDKLDVIRDAFGKEIVEQYGRVYRIRMPGSLSAVIEWKDQPTTLRFVIEGGRMTIYQDGQELSTTAIDVSLFEQLKPAEFRWGQGLFGAVGGRIAAHEIR